MAAGQRLLNADLADAVLVGGVDTLCKLTLNGFDSLESLSSGICQPCGTNRDGINIGEAAGLFLLSKAPAAVMLLSSGESMDAWHISAPHPEGKGAAEAMQKALDTAQLEAGDIDYLNLHGTSTPQNDAMEIKAVQTVFSDAAVALSSTKHKTGHCLGAAGAIEAFICQQVLLDQSWLPLHHAGELDDVLAGQNYVLTPHLNTPIRYAMSNSFAFGGSNISLIFGTALS
jgi:3-oxoacyl-[acyl-carrier-protein] synthase-1